MKMKDFLRHHHAIGRLGVAEEIAPGYFSMFQIRNQFFKWGFDKY